ncbi:hypothetical protein IG631_19112 [Alternaria alternata]|nr:hypothetical protein IG631_19112 [Alternaria alternata]
MDGTLESTYAGIYWDYSHQLAVLVGRSAVVQVPSLSRQMVRATMATSHHKIEQANLLIRDLLE